MMETPKAVGEFIKRLFIFLYHAIGSGHAWALLAAIVGLKMVLSDEVYLVDYFWLFLSIMCLMLSRIVEELKISNKAQKDFNSLLAFVLKYYR